jgi:hypothetical protein
MPKNQIFSELYRCKLSVPFGHAGVALQFADTSKKRDSALVRPAVGFGHLDTTRWAGHKASEYSAPGAGSNCRRLDGAEHSSESF